MGGTSSLLGGTAPLAPRSDSTKYKSTIERKKTDAKSSVQKTNA